MPFRIIDVGRLDPSTTLRCINASRLKQTHDSAARLEFLAGLTPATPVRHLYQAGWVDYGSVSEPPTQLFEEPGPIHEGHEAEFVGIGSTSRDWRVLWSASTGTFTTWYHLLSGPARIAADARIEAWFSWLDDELLVSWHNYDAETHGSFTSQDSK
jgi:hypothetical protein